MNSRTIWAILVFVLATLNATASINSTLSIWSTDAEVDINVFFFANYSHENSSIEGDCKINIESTESDMIFNHSLYFYSTSFSDPGNYSYEIGCNSEDHDNQTKQASIEIIEIDNDNDGYANDDCNDNDADINPGQKEILYNNIDDDCNPATLDYVVFEITSNKETFSTGETVSINTNANNGSDTYITINTPINVSFVYIFANGSYPITQEFSLTNLAGKYSVEGVNYLDNYTNTDYLEFNVESSMNIEIEIDDDSVYEDEEIHFKAIIIGATGSVNLIWNMDDGSEKYDEEFDYSYNTQGTYNIVLIATDQDSNQVIKTRQVTVKRQYYLKVRVVDNSTDEIIPNATVKLDSKSKDVNSSGMAEFSITNKTYELKVTADDYIKYKEDIKIDNSLIFTVKLNRNHETEPPIITIISPSDNAVQTNPEFKFKFTDESKATCTLYVSEDQNWWFSVNSTTNLESGKEYIFTPNLDYKSYYWKLECIDSDYNVAYSPEYVLEVKKEEVQSSGQPDLTYTVVQDVYDIITDFETYTPDERLIAEYLNLDVSIKDAKRKLEMANRDLFNLRYQEDTDTVITTRNEIYDRINKIKDDTPQSLSVLNKVDFVKYVDDADIEALLEEYSELKNIELTKKVLEQNKELQKKLSVETVAYNVELVYVSGRTQQITMIVRKIRLSSNSPNTMYVEFLPKDLVKSANDIAFVTEVDIIKEDPVFELKLVDATEIVYYIKDKVNLDSIPKIKPLLIKTDIDASMNKISGFAVFDSLGFSQSNTKIFIVEILVIVILVGVYLYYNSKVPEKPSSAKPITPIVGTSTPNTETYTPNAKLDHHKVNYIRNVLDTAQKLLASNQLEQAALKYYEIKFLYDLLEENDKYIVFNEVIQLSDELAYQHIKKLIDDAIIELAKGNRDKAVAHYEEIQSEYDKLSSPYQNKIYSRCCELALHLK